MSLAHIYEVFGLRVSMPHVSSLLPAAKAGAAVDVHVEYGAVPARPSDIVFEHYDALMDAHVAIDDASNVWWTTSRARFHIVGGRQVQIELLDPATKPGLIVRSVLSCCLPAAIIQRGSLALHANAIATPQGAVVIAGASGAGKSTLLGAFVSHGLPMLSDDVTALHSTPSGVHAAPGFPQYRLCEDALQRLSPRNSTVFALGGSRGKYAVSAPLTAFESRAVKLKAIYVLSTSDAPDVEITQLKGLPKLAALRASSYAPLCLTHSPKHIALLGKFASSIQVYCIRRPRERWTVDELVGLIAGDPSQAAQHVA